MITNGDAFQLGIEKIDFSGYISGRVVDIDKENKQIAVIIPKFIPTNNEYSKKKEDIVFLNNRCVINKDDIKPEVSNTIIKKNYLMVKPLTNLNDEFIFPKIGKEILVVFLDNDPQKAYYLPFSITI